LVLLSLVGFLPSFCIAQSENILMSSKTEALTSAEAGLAGSDASGASAAAIPEPGTAQQHAGASHEARLGIGVKVSTLGVGGEVAVRVLNRANVRAGFNLLGISHSFASNGITYSGSLHLRSAEAHFDYFLFRSFHVSPGVLLYNGDNLSATASVASGQTFTVSGTQYESSASNPIAATFTASVNKVAPEILIGIGNLVPRGSRHWSINADFGVAYEGAPKIAFGVTGIVCQPPNTTGLTCVNAGTDPTVQGNVVAQQAQYNHDVSTQVYYRLWPVISTGFSYSF
jgi:hypothetical protein